LHKDLTLRWQNSGNKLHSNFQKFKHLLNQCGLPLAVSITMCTFLDVMSHYTAGFFTS